MATMKTLKENAKKHMAEKGVDKVLLLILIMIIIINIILMIIITIIMILLIPLTSGNSQPIDPVDLQMGRSTDRDESSLKKQRRIRRG